MPHLLSPLLLTLLPLASPPQDAPDAALQLEALFAPASADMVIPVGEGGDSWTLLDVLQDYSQITGQHVRMNEQTRAHLASQPTGLTRSAAVPRGEVQSFVENLLMGQDCVMNVERTAEPRLIALHWMNAYRNAQLRDLALFVPESELDRLRVHPTLILSTAVDLPNVDVRQLANSLRILMTDSNRQVLVPAGASATLAVTGPAPWVWQIVQLVRAADESSRQEAAAASATFVRLQLEHASAEEVADTVQELLRASTTQSVQSNQGGLGRPYADRLRVDARVLADVRTNALLASVMPADVARLRELVALVDVVSN